MRPDHPRLAIQLQGNVRERAEGAHGDLGVDFVRNFDFEIEISEFRTIPYFDRDFGC